jgi:hypothetical protein
VTLCTNDTFCNLEAGKIKQWCMFASFLAIVLVCSFISFYIILSVKTVMHITFHSNVQWHLEHILYTHTHTHIFLYTYLKVEALVVFSCLL